MIWSKLSSRTHYCVYHTLGSTVVHNSQVLICAVTSPWLKKGKMEKIKSLEAERVPTREEFYEGYAKNMSIAMKYELKCAQIRKAYEEVYGEEMDTRLYIDLIDHRGEYQE